MRNLKPKRTKVKPTTRVEKGSNETRGEAAPPCDDEVLEWDPGAGDGAATQHFDMVTDDGDVSTLDDGIVCDRSGFHVPLPHLAKQGRRGQPLLAIVECTDGGTGYDRIEPHGPQLHLLEQGRC